MFILGSIEDSIEEILKNTQSLSIEKQKHIMQQEYMDLIRQSDKSYSDVYYLLSSFIKDKKEFNKAMNMAREIIFSRG